MAGDQDSGEGLAGKIVRVISERVREWVDEVKQETRDQVDMLREDLDEELAVGQLEGGEE